MPIYSVQTAIFFQKAISRLFPYPCDSRNIIRFIPHQSLQIDDLRRNKSYFFFEVSRRELQNIAYTFTRITDISCIVDKLISVAISCIDIGLDGKTFCQCANNVVGFIAFEFTNFYFHQSQQFFQYGNLYYEFLRHRFASGFIFCIHFVSKGRSM